jgi:hypothetical protein
VLAIDGIYSLDRLLRLSYPWARPQSLQIHGIQDFEMAVRGKHALCLWPRRLSTIINVHFVINNRHLDTRSEFSDRPEYLAGS